MSLVWFAITVMVGLCGSLAAHRMKVPAGFMIGALVLVAIFNIVWGKAVMPSQIKVLTQIIAGVFIGAKIGRKDLDSLRKVFIPAVASALMMILLCMGIGVLVCLMTGLTAVTSLLGCAPGGIVDMTLIGMDLGADTSVMSVLHVVRLVAVVGVFPPILRQLVGRVREPSEKPSSAMKTKQCMTDEDESVQTNRLPKPVRIMITALTAVVFGLFGKWTGIPAGTLLFSMIGSALLNIFTGQALMPLKVKQTAQMLAGTLIGVSVTLEAVLQMRALLLPAVLMIFCYFGINMLLAFFLYKIWHFDMLTAFFPVRPEELPISASWLRISAETLPESQLCR